MEKAKNTIQIINKRIDAVGKKTAAWREEIQEILVDAAEHAFLHSNVDPFTRLINVLKGADIKAVSKWIETHAPARWDGKENKYKTRKIEAEYDREFLLGEKWYDRAQTPREIVSEFDVLKLVQDMLKKADREVNATKNIKTILHKELMFEVQAAVGKYVKSQEKADK